VRFFTRLPVPAATDGDFDFNRLAWAAPVAGAVIGLVGAAALGAARALGLPPWVAATLAIAALVAASGALHEDGLADVADGFGGGAIRERKLAIMRDSRIGAFGAVALVLSLVIRIGALSAALAHGFWAAAGALVLAAAVSRAGALAPLALLDPARADGVGAAAGRLEPESFAAACGAAVILALALGLVATGVGHALAGLIGAAIGAGAMTALARRQIGGQTGDVAGAAQQWAEIAAWCGLLVGRSAA
jgi:adenosylcobinamide-GDP ribazoletransferase